VLPARKVYHFLGKYDKAFSFTLGAGNAFEAKSRTNGAEGYVETVVCEWLLMELWLPMLNVGPCSHSYRCKGKVDARLQSIIENIFRRFIDDGEYKQVSMACHDQFCC
jgi:hypothetical protein